MRQIFFLDARGKLLLFRDYRGDTPLSCVDVFTAELRDLEETGQARPVFIKDGITYAYVQHSNLMLLAVSRCNMNATTALLFLHKIVEIFTHYFSELEEESLRDNFVIAYELLDEVMDNGYPQFTESRILEQYIKTDAHKMADAKPPVALTNAVSWRQEGLKYKKNEIFLDVVESVHMLLSPQGTPLRSEIAGALKMRAFLSGMPECKLGLNDKVLIEAQGKGGGGKSVDLEDIKFHQCVRLTKFETDRTISFIPPDGAFDLMTYRLTTEVQPLIQLECTVERHSRSRIEYHIKARSTFKDRHSASNVEINVPIPSDAIAPQVRVSHGQGEYRPEAEACQWTLKQWGGGREMICKIKYGLPSVEAEERADTKKPITVKFEIQHFTTSGIQVRYLKVFEKTGYHALPWVSEGRDNFAFLIYI